MVFKRASFGPFDIQRLTQCNAFFDGCFFMYAGITNALLSESAKKVPTQQTEFEAEQSSLMARHAALLALSVGVVR